MGWQGDADNLEEAGDNADSLGADDMVFATLFEVGLLEAVEIEQQIEPIRLEAGSPAAVVQP